MADPPDSSETPAEQDFGVPDANMIASGTPKSRNRGLVVIAGLLIVGVFLNSMLWYISRPQHRGLVHHDDLSLSTLVVTEQRTLRLRYSFEAYLHDLARQGIITVPDADAIDVRTVENLSQMTVAVDDYDDRITQDRIDSLSPAVEIGGVGSVSKAGEDAAYWFLMSDESPAPSVTYFTIGSHVYIIDDRLLGR